MIHCNAGARVHHQAGYRRNRLAVCDAPRHLAAKPSWVCHPPRLVMIIGNRLTQDEKKPHPGENLSFRHPVLIPLPARLDDGQARTDPERDSRTTAIVGVDQADMLGEKRRGSRPVPS